MFFSVKGRCFEPRIAHHITARNTCRMRELMPTPDPEGLGIKFFETLPEGWLPCVWRVVGPEVDQFGNDADCNFVRSVGSYGQADGAMHTIEIVLCEALGEQ